MVAVDKPEGLASIPERDPAPKSLLTLLSSRVPVRLYVVHRLDKDVSGVILFAKHAAAHRHLNLQFDRRTVRKSYMALVHGSVEKDSGRVEAPIRPFGSGRVAVDGKKGKASCTEYRVVRRCPSHTLVRLHPLTGRRHQLRVHLYSIGHPVAGDKRYGDPELQKPYARLMLHAERIAFRLPSGNPVTVESPLPASFGRIVDALCP